LLQGIADHDLHCAGEETCSPAQRGVTAVLRQLAHAMWASWQSGCCRLPALPPVPLCLNGLPETIETRQCEGFAHYAVYPEAYAAAAAGSGLSSATHVI